MPKPIEVKPLENFRLWLHYDDETTGEVDLSDLAGRGVFKVWENPDVFKQVKVGSYGEVTWGGDLELCPDSLYLRLTKKSPEDLFPTLKTGVNA